MSADRPRFEVITSSELDAPTDEVWAQITSYEGINYELRPLMRMTAPREVRDAGLASVTLGERLCRSWVLLFGFIPIEYDDITLVEFEPGRRFLERSPMFSQRLWEHERTVEPTGEGSRVTDRIRFEPRFALPPGRLLVPVIRRVFRHRHRRLRKRFGGRPA